ncbi:MAG: tRNA (adenosine(37)-N6)-dimethylallyltransferase MiaA [Cyclobacteriaceae bacterium]
MTNKRSILVSVVGSTAVGKTSFGISLANRFDTEVLSVDSRQFYREMEIGTAKPTKHERGQAVHHFVDTLSIKEEYSVGKFETDALNLLDQMFKKHEVVVAVGGSGLFFKAIWEGFDDMPDIKPGIRQELNDLYQEEGIEPLLNELSKHDPVYYDQVDRSNWQRVIRALEVIRSTGLPFSSFRKKNKSKERPFANIKLGLDMEREVLFDRINKRMDLMIEEGLFEEAAKLYPFRETNALQTVGYSEIFGFMDGNYDREEAIRLLKRNSRRYAKRQMTWFKRDPEIIWLSPDQIDQAIDLISKKLD